VVAAAVDKYVYVSANRRFYDSIRLAYSKTEIVSSVDTIDHPIFREALRLAGITSGIELTSVADVPSGSGLGSSSSFTVALLNALHTFKREYVSSRDLAEEACQIEMERLREPIGKQDQYIAAYGGVTAFTFGTDGSVEVERVPIRPEVREELESNLLVFYSGVEREAGKVLSEQGKNIEKNEDQAVERMHRIKELGYETRRILAQGNIDAYGELLHEHWTNKRKLASKMSDPSIDEHYEAARAAGVIGGKLMGAGGGGFFLFYATPADRRRVYAAMTTRGLRPLRFRFESSGAQIVANLSRSE
jgi:D-glycero-alpha-D-manno-heptose-7-phosphate kinase